MMEISKEVQQGQAIYSKPILRLYDLWVLGISNKYIWKCPTIELLRHFNTHISSNHLDVGVGTGYFLDNCLFPSNDINITLIDLNQNSLNEAAKRISRYKPRLFRVNVLDKINIGTDKFSSISVNYLFHCLPGTLSEKLSVLENVDHLLIDGGKVFGSTILAGDVTRNKMAKKLMTIYNEKGIFNNLEDNYEDLVKYLSINYSNYNISIRGCVAIFSATK